MATDNLKSFEMMMSSIKITITIWIMILESPSHFHFIILLLSGSCPIHHISFVSIDPTEHQLSIVDVFGFYLLATNSLFNVQCSVCHLLWLEFEFQMNKWWLAQPNVIKLNVAMEKGLNQLPVTGLLCVCSRIIPVLFVFIDTARVRVTNTIQSADPYDLCSVCRVHSIRRSSLLFDFSLFLAIWY